MILLKYIQKQTGQTLVIVLVFLMSITLLSVASISTLTLQFKTAANQVNHSKAQSILTNVFVLLTHELSGAQHNSAIKNLSLMSSKSNGYNSFTQPSCDSLELSKWLPITLNMEAIVVTNEKKSHLTQLQSWIGVLDVTTQGATSDVDGMQNTDIESPEINITRQTYKDSVNETVETLVIHQCIKINYSTTFATNTYLTNTTIIERVVGTNINIQVKSRRKSFESSGNEVSFVHSGFEVVNKGLES